MENNPYVGPRPYERGDRHNFYGREREARDLLSLILAERVVLFYAASGAGKTSLLNAEIIPGLEAEGFHVLDPVRVGSELPPDVDPQDVENVFVFSALMGLAGEDVPAKGLIDQTLLSFLREQGLGQGRGPGSREDRAVQWELDTCPPILILDQFEELFTTHRGRWRDATGFFEQVREALQELPALGVVFIMREDRVAELDPYAPQLPGRLRTRFRMERLDREGALAAVRRPAENVGCPFDPGVAELLVDDLRRIKRFSEMGRQRDRDPVFGPYVEPVQLQVVCTRLWENLPEQEDNAIQWAEIEAFGDVDRALTDFYEHTLARCVRETGVRQRQVRHWFSEQLITPIGTRGLALREEHETRGLPNEAVDILEEEHVIRADRRAGARWYELAHDRFVEPIQQANRLWRERRQRTLFTTLGAIAVVLILAVTVAWSIWRQAEATATAAAVESELWVSLARDRLRPLKPGLSVSGATGTAGTIGAFARSARGDYWLISAKDILGPSGLGEDSLVLQPGRADQGQVPDDVIGYSVVTTDSFTDGMPLASLVGLAYLDESVEFETSIPGIGPLRGIREPGVGASIQMLGRTSGLVQGSILQSSVTTTIHMVDGAVQFTNGVAASVAIAPGDGGALVVDEEGYAIGIVVAGSQSSALLAPIQGVLQGLAVELVFSGQRVFTLSESDILSAEWLPDGERLVTGGRDGVVTLWNAQDREVESVLRGHEGAINALVAGPSGHWLVSASEDTTVRLWDLTAQDPVTTPIVLRGHEAAVVAVAISPDEQWLVSCSRDGGVRLWDLVTSEPTARVAFLTPGPGITDVAISPDGQSFTTGDRNGTVLLRLPPWRDAMLMQVHHTDDAVVDLSFSADGSRLTATSANGEATSWSVDTGERITQLTWPTGQVNEAAWSPQAARVVIAAAGSPAAVWGEDGSLLFTLEGYSGDTLHTAWSPDGVWILTVGEDGRVRVWRGR